MLIDHIGLFFFPDIIYMRLIGRLSFPLFAWLLANGAYQTKNINKYLYRLLSFSIISQLPYLAAMRLLDPHFTGLNIFFTLSIGLAVIIGMKKIQNRKYWLIVLFTGCVFAELINTDYGAFGILIIVIFYLFFQKPVVLFLLQSFIFLVFSIIGYITYEVILMVQIVGIGAFCFIYFYNHKKGKSFKYYFYLAYPLQYILFYFIYQLQR